MVYKFNIEGTSTVTVTRLRSIAAQVIACMSLNLLLLDLGLAINFATIALPVLLGATEGLSLNGEQASWFGSISFLTQPFGAVFSGPLVDYVGRKKANFLVNIPHVIAWILLYYTWNLPTLFVAAGLLGFGTGVMEAPTNAYIGEITEPSIRGTLCTFAQLFVSVGMLIMYFLGTVVDWRTAALICLAVPVASMIFILFVPETPVWLLYQGRDKDALKSLCYLRGWTDKENVRDEFDKLVEYTKKLERCVICCKTSIQNDAGCEHDKMNWMKRYVLKFRYIMLVKETMRPLTLIIMYFAFYVMSGLAPLRPNMVNVCAAMGMPSSSRDILLIVGIITFVSASSTVVIIKLAGKRKLAITSMLGCAVSTTALAIYARANLDDKVFSFDVSTFPKEVSYIPQTLFFMLVIFTGLGIPWVLFGEVFPFRSRTTAQGISAGASYIINFVGAKTFIDLESSVKLWGTFTIYAILGYIGVIYLYFFLPETERKTLQEIESFYNGKLRTFADDPFINMFKRTRSTPSKPHTNEPI